MQQARDNRIHGLAACFWYQSTEKASIPEPHANVTEESALEANRIAYELLLVK
jgi:hypothetical protein